MRSALKVALVLMLLAVLGLAVAGPASAGDTATCTTQTVSYETALDWTFQYLHIDAVTVQQVLTFRHHVVLEGPQILLQFDVEYIDVSGHTVLHSGSFVLSNSCTPDFQAQTSGWSCDYVSVTRELYREIADSGGVAVLSYSEWTEHEGGILGFDLYEKYTETEIYAFYYSYLWSFHASITTMTTTCTAPDPELLEVTVWPDTYQLTTNVAGMAFAINGEMIRRHNADGTRSVIVVPLEYRDRTTADGVLVPHQGFARLVTSHTVAEYAPSQYGDFLSHYSAFLVMNDGSLVAVQGAWYDIDGEFLPITPPGTRGFAEYRPAQ